MYFSRVFAPTIDARTPIRALSMFPLALFTMDAAKGEANTTPRDAAAIVDASTWPRMTVYVAKPTRLTSVSDSASKVASARFPSAVRSVGVGSRSTSSVSATTAKKGLENPGRLPMETLDTTMGNPF